jgi:signal peptidase II
MAAITVRSVLTITWAFRPSPSMRRTICEISVCEAPFFITTIMGLDSYAENGNESIKKPRLTWVVSGAWLVYRLPFVCYATFPAPRPGGLNQKPKKSNGVCIKAIVRADTATCKVHSLSTPSKPSRKTAVAQGFQPVFVFAVSSLDHRTQARCLCYTQDCLTMQDVPRSRLLVFMAIAGLGCAIDLATKHWIFQRLGFPQQETIWLVQDVLSLETSLNEGALFGVGQGFTFLFAALSLAAGVWILFWLFGRGAARDLWLTVALAAIMAGILGNLYDRLGLPGLTWPVTPIHNEGDPVFAVRDWIHFQYQSFDWPVFNIADSLLVLGAGLLLRETFRKQQSADEPASAAARTPV